VAAKEETAERLMDEGFRALDDYETKQAIKIGRRLQKMRHSSAFEILALAYAKQNKLNKAIKILEEGVRKAPSVWKLWGLLGNYYSEKVLQDGLQKAPTVWNLWGLLGNRPPEQQSYEKSHACYQKALACADADEGSIHLNIAIALNREEKHEEALRQVGKVTSDELRLHAAAVKMDLLNILGRFREARELGERAVTQAPGDEKDKRQLAEIHAHLGVALLKDDGDREEALRCAWRAVRLCKEQETAMWLIREASSATSPTARYMMIIVRGRWHVPVEDEREPPGFFANYEVVADSQEEALDFIRPFEPEEVRETLVVEECDVLEKSPDIPKGVYVSYASHIFFPWDKA